MDPQIVGFLYNKDPNKVPLTPETTRCWLLAQEDGVLRAILQDA